MILVRDDWLYTPPPSTGTGTGTGRERREPTQKTERVHTCAALRCGASTSISRTPFTVLVPVSYLTLPYLE